MVKIRVVPIEGLNSIYLVDGKLYEEIIRPLSEFVVFDFEQSETREDGTVVFKATLKPPPKPKGSDNG